MKLIDSLSQSACLWVWVSTFLPPIQSVHSVPTLSTTNFVHFPGLRGAKALLLTPRTS